MKELSSGKDLWPKWAKCQHSGRGGEDHSPLEVGSKSDSLEAKPETSVQVIN